MKYGELFYDSEIGRINAQWEDGSYGDGYHCGDILEVRRPSDAAFAQLRLEYDESRDEWHFIGAGAIPCGTEVRE